MSDLKMKVKGGSVIEAKDIDVLILCGGLGKRLRSIVSDRPKPMAEINGRPFLDILMDYVSGYGFRRFVLCAGYKSEYIDAYYTTKNGTEKLLISKEEKPLNTAGAVKQAESYIQSENFMVMNGDSICRFDLEDFLRFHIESKAQATIALVEPQKEDDYGVAMMDGDNRITEFQEKGKTKDNGYISTGIYLFQKELLSHMPENSEYSIEYDLLPNLIGRELYGYVAKSKLIDIGTPERFRSAGNLIADEVCA